MKNCKKTQTHGNVGLEHKTLKKSKTKQTLKQEKMQRKILNIKGLEQPTIPQTLDKGKESNPAINKNALKYII